ncbi:MAG: DNA-3-methyladenine glycosylase family protein [Actinomycetota bacterium]
MSRSRTFSVPGPVDLRLTLGPLRCGAGDHRLRLAAREAWRACHTPEGPATLHLRLTTREVAAEAWGPGAGWVLDTAPDLLGASDYPEGFCPTDPVMRSLTRGLPGLRLTRSLCVYELLVPTILEQKVTSIEARRSFAALLRRYGSPAPGPAGLWVLPAPELLAELPYHVFHPLGVERRQAEVLRAVARRAGRLEETTSMSPAAALRRLLALPGIGPWTASTVVNGTLGEGDTVVPGDFHFPNLAAWVLAGEPRADDARMLELLEPYRGHRGRVMRYVVASGIRPPKFGPKHRLRDFAAV